MPLRIPHLLQLTFTLPVATEISKKNDGKQSEPSKGLLMLTESNHDRRRKQILTFKI